MWWLDCCFCFLSFSQHFCAQYMYWIYFSQVVQVDRDIWILSGPLKYFWPGLYIFSLITLCSSCKQANWEAAILPDWDYTGWLSSSHLWISFFLMSQWNWTRCSTPVSLIYSDSPRVSCISCIHACAVPPHSCGLLIRLSPLFSLFLIPYGASVGVLHVGFVYWDESHLLLFQMIKLLSLLIWVWLLKWNSIFYLM